MTPMVPGVFAFGTEALTQRWSWGRVRSRRSGGTWQRRWHRARKPGPAEIHKSLQAGTGANHSHSILFCSAAISDRKRIVLHIFILVYTILIEGIGDRRVEVSETV